MSTLLESLSPREVQTLAHAADGLGDKEIAARLGVSLTTVRTYWERLFHKLEAANRAEAVAIYVRGVTDDIPRIPGVPLEQAALLQAAVDATVGGILVLNADGTVAASNQKACALLNCERGTLEGQPVQSFVPSHYQRFYHVLNAAMVQEEENIYTVSTFIRVLGATDLLCTITIRTLDGPEGRHTVLFIHDTVSDIDARRRGHAAIV